MSIARGSLVLVDLDPDTGREQAGTRPCVVLSPESLVADQRYPLLIVVPFTSTQGLGPLYPIVPAYRGGLVAPSAALVDQVRSIDKGRVRKLYAPLPPTEMRRIDEAFRKVAGL